jgi:predicted dinucleotide-utilizing enzyme
MQQLGVSDSQFQTAVSACNHLLPNGGSEPQQTAQQKHTRLADELSFARCMRNHGVSRFPDPTAQGDLSVEMVQAQGIDIHSPAVLHAVQTCLPASHGALTAAKVREALSRAGG